MVYFLLSRVIILNKDSDKVGLDLISENGFIIADREAAPMLCCSVILGNSQILWERVCEQLMIIHCILAGVCLRTVHRMALKQSQRKNTQLKSLIQVFWRGPCFPDLALPTPRQEKLSSAKALRGLAWPCRHMNTTGVWGNYCLTSTCWGAAEMGGIPEGAQGNARGPKAVQLPQLLTGWSQMESPSLGCSQWASPPWRTSAPHTMEKVTPALGLRSVTMGCTTPTQPTTAVMAMTKLATVI